MNFMELILAVLSVSNLFVAERALRRMQALTDERNALLQRRTDRMLERLSNLTHHIEERLEEAEKQP